MKFQIVGPDNRAALDGEWFDLDLASLDWHPAYYAVQFDDDKGGEVEWVRAGSVTPPNLKIDRDQFLGMFGGVVAHVRTLAADRRAEEERRKAEAVAKQIADLEKQLAAAKAGGA